MPFTLLPHFIYTKSVFLLTTSSSCEMLDMFFAFSSLALQGFYFGGSKPKRPNPTWGLYVCRNLFLHFVVLKCVPHSFTSYNPIVHTVLLHSPVLYFPSLSVLPPLSFSVACVASNPSSITLSFFSLNVCPLLQDTAFDILLSRFTVFPIQ